MNYTNTIIIGAGIAGIYYIHKFKLTDYIILEKDDRIGGRIFNITWHDKQISLGGAIIKYSNNNTLKLIKELNFELTSFSSSYHLIDLDKNLSKEEIYNSNKIIIKYLRKIYKKNKNEIIKMSLSFKEFLLKYLDYQISRPIIDNLLYKTYLDADVSYTLKDETIYELLRIDDLKLFSINNGGYTLLLNKLIEKNKIKNILTNKNVIKIEKNEDKFLVYTLNEIYSCNKLVLATDKYAKINFNFDLGCEITDIYNLVNSSAYIRIYTYHKNGHGLTYSIRTSNIPGKINIINDNILMACYTESYDAIELQKILEKNNKIDQIEIIYKILLNTNINITKPDDIIHKFWNCGIHYFEPNTNYNKMREKIKLLSSKNIYLIGELFSSSHGWVDNALDSVNKLYEDIN